MKTGRTHSRKLPNRTKEELQNAKFVMQNPMNAKSNGNDYTTRNKYQLITRFFGHVSVDLSILKYKAKKLHEKAHRTRVRNRIVTNIGFFIRY